MVSAGFDSGLAVRAEGTVVGWGNNEYCRMNVPAGLAGVVSVAAGWADGQSLALKADGTVVSWGGCGWDTNRYPLPIVPIALSNVVSLASGYAHRLTLTGRGAPVLTTSLVGRAALADGTAYFRVEASGAWPISYQWQFDGTNLPGATESVLQLTHLQVGQTGNYTVTASNALGVITSPPAHLAVLPVFADVAPQSQVTNAGGSATFTFHYEGSSVLSYQWRFNGTNLPGATNSTLSLSNLRPDQSGAYMVVVNNVWGTTTAEADLFVNQVIAWGDDSTGQTDLPVLTNIVAVSAGATYSLALKSDGTVSAWGGLLGSWRIFDPAFVPDGLSNVVSVAGSAGFDSIALRSDGSVVKWGYSGLFDMHPQGTNYVQTVVTNVVAVTPQVALKKDGTVVDYNNQPAGPNGLTNVVALASGGDSIYEGITVLALSADGTVIAWNDWSGQVDVPAGLTDVVEVAAGASHFMALRADGTVVAWGQFWSPPNGTNFVPATVPAGLTNVVSIAAGGGTSLALLVDGIVVAWGNNDYGQTNLPTNLTNVVAVSAGATTSLALVGNGAPFLGGPIPDRTIFEGGTVYFRVAAAGAMPLAYQWQFNGTNLHGASRGVLVLTNVQPWQAGAYVLTVSNASGVVTSSPALLHVVPSLVGVAPEELVIFAGGEVTFSAGVETAAPVSYQWQFNDTNLAGATNRVLALTNVELEQAGTYTLTVSNIWGSVSCAPASLAVNLVAAWGDDSVGQTDAPSGLTNVIAVAAGYLGSLALRSDGTVVAWGAFLTEGTILTETNVPAGLSNVVAIATGIDHSMALRADGTVVCWGDNYFGQTNVPAGLTNAVAVAAGYQFSCALRADGSVLAWGDVRATVPAGLTNVVAISAGGIADEGLDLALRGDGTVVAWGWFSSGGTNVPPDLTNAIMVAAGAGYGLALRAEGTVAAWGNNSSGQTNVPAGLTNVVAVAARGYQSFALRGDGTLVVWGGLPTTVPAGLANVIAISAGWSHALALIGFGPPVSHAPVNSPALTPGRFTVSLPSQSGRVYALEFKDSLMDTTWNPLPLAAGNGGALTLTDPTATNSPRFYRVRRW
jgi:alpha-tubulin suppressor-like RCC1 family protein